MPIPLLTIPLRDRGIDMNKTYIVRLTADEHPELFPLTRAGKAAPSKIKHASIRLHVHANGSKESDGHVAKALPWHSKTVRHVRQRFVAPDLEAAVVRKKHPKLSHPRLRDSAKEAHVRARRCGLPPNGHAKWP
jgi:hypothetical protein